METSNAERLELSGFMPVYCGDVKVLCLRGKVNDAEYVRKLVEHERERLRYIELKKRYAQTHNWHALTNICLNCGLEARTVHYHRNVCKVVLGL